MIYNLYRVILGSMCIIGVLLYAFFAAFGYYFEEDVEYEDRYMGLEEKDWQTLKDIYWVIEGTYIFDFFCQFILEYLPPGSQTPVRDVKLIAKNYIKTNFIFDAITLFPFGILLNF